MVLWRFPGSGQGCGLEFPLKVSGFNALLIFQAKTDWEGNFEIVKRNEEKEAEEEEEEDEKRNERRTKHFQTNAKSFIMAFDAFGVSSMIHLVIPEVVKAC
ncbi:hypothetical protein NC651_023571 [Populus alba x Populus x berolinensis]|nr:hypothetical protein NC651_023571 [Populus alba x Populus x berolinensis]